MKFEIWVALPTCKNVLLTVNSEATVDIVLGELRRLELLQDELQYEVLFEDVLLKGTTLLTQIDIQNYSKLWVVDRGRSIRRRAAEEFGNNSKQCSKCGCRALCGEGGEWRLSKDTETSEPTKYEVDRSVSAVQSWVNAQQLQTDSNENGDGRSASSGDTPDQNRSTHIGIVLLTGYSIYLRIDNMAVTPEYIIRRLLSRGDIPTTAYQLVKGNAALVDSMSICMQHVAPGDSLHVVNKARRQRVLDPGPVRNEAPGSILLVTRDKTGRDRASQMLEPENAVLASAGLRHWAIVDDQGVIYTWGDNQHRALGRNGVTCTPAHIPGLVNNMAVVRCGHTFTIALDTLGNMWAWGVFVRQDGLITPIGGYHRPGLVDVDLKTGEVFIDIAAGTAHAIALTSHGRVLTWGYNEQHQLGRETINRRDNARLILTPIGLSGIVQIACGYFHSFAISNDGTVFAWGLNTHGQTGIPVKHPGKVIDGIETSAVVENYVTTPTVVDTLKAPVRQVTAAKERTLVLYTDGSIEDLGTEALFTADLPDMVHVAVGSFVDFAQTGDDRVFRRSIRNNVIGEWVEWELHYKPVFIASDMVLAVPGKQLLVLNLEGVLVDRETEKERPGLRNFLSFVFDHFDVMLWSSAPRGTVMYLADKVFGELQKDLVALWARDKFRLAPEQYNTRHVLVKDLQVVWDEFRDRYWQHNTIHIDTPSNTNMQPDNLVCVPKFNPKEADTEEVFSHLIEYLTCLLKQNNVLEYICTHPY